MSDLTDEADSPRISTRAALWKSFLTVSVVLPWGMIACLSVFMSGLAMGTGSTSNNAIIRSITPIAPAILLWFAYSLGVSICSKRREFSVIMGLILGWLYLSLWLSEATPGMILQLFSPKNDVELLKGVLVSYITGAGWLVSSGFLLFWLKAKMARAPRQKEEHS
jgi:hypothetical protein